jgi:beta-lactamase superfamily II metal-dependent hydrolase
MAGGSNQERPSPARDKRPALCRRPRIFVMTAVLDSPHIANPAVSVEVLPACGGDCIWVECSRTSRQPFRILIDGGTTEAWPALRNRVMQLDRGERVIDLAVVTHVDSDHIGGMLRLFEETEALGLRIGDVWFNGLQHLLQKHGPTRTIAEGESLTSLLLCRDRRSPIPWNLAFQGEAVMTNGHQQIRRAPLSQDSPRITLLSPTPAALANLRTVWEQTLGSALRGEREEAEEIAGLPSDLNNLESLAKTVTPLDSSIPNASSIAFVLEHGGVRCLFAADASTRILGAALTAFGNSRDGRPQSMDMVKLPHHGSKANVTSKLLALCPAAHYIVSTDSSAHGHPHDIALARAVLCNPGFTRSLWFNYATLANQRWSNQSLTARYNFVARLPANHAGITLDLPGKEHV